MRLAIPLVVLAVISPARAAWGAPQNEPRLFDSEDVLALRISTDLGALMKERDSTDLKTHPATLSYTAADGRAVTMPAELTLRGHWRRQRTNCDFAPIALDFPKGARAGTLFEDQGKLKLVTHCRSSRDEYEQYILREYAVYKLASLVTPVALRARLLRVTYVDSVRGDSLTRNAFFIENAKRAAQRLGAEVYPAQGVSWGSLDADIAARMSLFQYMIGGTDWSLPGLHNVVLLVGPKGTLWPLPYDFDITGIVATRYARPNPVIGIKSVRERVYRGICGTAEEWAPTIALFNQQRDSLYAVYDSIPGLDPKYVKDTREYLDEFFKVINDPKRLKRELIDDCRRS